MNQKPTVVIVTSENMQCSATAKGSGFKKRNSLLSTELTPEITSKTTTAFMLVFILACNPHPQPEQKSEQRMSKRSLEQVQESHTKELMTIPGVVGTAIGQSEDGSPALLVFVEEKTDEITRKVPTELEGYPVRIQVTGKIVPIR